MNLLVTFEAVSRRLSVTEAGRELGLTQSAVSRQIQRLEEELATRLFERHHRAISLTEQGQALFESVSVALNIIGERVSDIREVAERSQIMVSTSVAVASFWLLPRLSRFRAMRPEIDVYLLTEDPPGLDPRRDIDAVIAFGPSRPRNLQPRLLFHDEVFPVCSPAYRDARGPVREIDDLLGLTLLHMDALDPSWMDWRDWFQAMGHDRALRTSGPRFNKYDHTIQACLAGDGVALGWHRLIASYLTSGTLVRLTDRALRTEGGYYLAVTPKGAKSAEVRAFCDWLVKEAELPA